MYCTLAVRLLLHRKKTKKTEYVFWNEVVVCSHWWTLSPCATLGLCAHRPVCSVQSASLLRPSVLFAAALAVVYCLLVCVPYAADPLCPAGTITPERKSMHDDQTFKIVACDIRPSWWTSVPDRWTGSMMIIQMSKCTIGNTEGSISCDWAVLISCHVEHTCCFLFAHLLLNITIWLCEHCVGWCLTGLLFIPMLLLYLCAVHNASSTWRQHSHCLLQLVV